MKKYYLYLYRWLSIANYKDVKILYSLFGFIAGIIGTLLNIIIGIELVYTIIGILNKDWWFYKRNIDELKLLNLFVIIIKNRNLYHFFNIKNFKVITFILLVIWNYGILINKNKNGK
jgi:hypothetical protein